MTTKRRVKNRGLLDFPLRKVTSRWSTGGNTNPPRTVFALECGHTAEYPGQFVCRKSVRCEDCGETKPTRA